MLLPSRFGAKPQPGAGALRWTVLLAGGVFVGLLVAVLRADGLAWDAPMLRYWHAHATPGLDKLAVFFTIVGNTGPMVGLALLVFLRLLRRGPRRAAWTWLAAVGGSMVVTQLIKRLVARPRPALWASLRPEHTFSFPSGHAMDTAAIAAALVLLSWNWPGRGWVRGLAPLFALAVGWARVYLGVHNPSDVLAGWAAALTWVAAVHLLAGPGPGRGSQRSVAGK